jgi:ribosomal protein S18 acetylase RimI-like enzyme
MAVLSTLTSPLPSAFRDQIGAIFLTSFSRGYWFGWMAKTPADSITDEPDKVPLRLQQYNKTLAHRELDPQIVIVCAVIDGQVLGYAIWRLPVSLARQETIFETVYRKASEVMDYVENWISPPRWRNEQRWRVYLSVQSECVDTYLERKKNGAWYLLALAVAPKCQRQGIGGILVDWGLNQARQRGEKAYTEASEAGRGLYLQKGFQIVGSVLVHDRDTGEQYGAPFMVWDPAHHQVGAIPQ